MNSLVTYAAAVYLVKALLLPIVATLFTIPRIISNTRSEQRAKAKAKKTRAAEAAEVAKTIQQDPTLKNALALNFKKERK
jgi:hypothetical protein